MEAASPETDSRDFRKPWWGLVALLPFTWALWQTERIPEGRSFAAASAKELAFDQYFVDLREVPAQPRVPVYFSFENRGTAPITLTSLKGSCGCLQPRLLNSQQRPLESGAQLQPEGRYVVYVDISTATEEPGPHDYSVTLEYQDSQGNPQQEKLGFALVIPERKVLVEPNQVLLYQFAGQSESRELTVTDARGQQLQIQSAELARPIPGVEVTLKGAQQTPAGFWQSQIEVALTQPVSSQRQTTFLLLRTSDPDYPLIRVPVLVQGTGTNPIQQVSGSTSVPPLPPPR